MKNKIKAQADLVLWVMWSCPVEFEITEIDELVLALQGLIERA